MEARSRCETAVALSGRLTHPNWWRAGCLRFFAIDEGLHWRRNHTHARLFGDRLGSRDLRLGGLAVGRAEWSLSVQSAPDWRRISGDTRVHFCDRLALQF